MALMTRRGVVAAGATLMVAGAPRKPWARDLPDLASVLVPVNPPKAPPDGVFYDADGRPHHLSEFLGHGMVVNFWATWCRPCIAEIPSLADLARILAPHDIAVLPLSSDNGGAKAVETWFAAHDVTGLPTLLDPDAAFAEAWGGEGIPTTHIIAEDGKERARATGAADWSTPAAETLIRALVKG
jgi:thiol-disulfide isomerase/thioredoxin